MGFMSPQELNDDPKRWLDIPHGLHGSLSGLMDKMFSGFSDKLVEEKVHCLRCENLEPFDVIVRATGKPGFCVGYVGDRNRPELMNIQANLQED